MVEVAVNLIHVFKIKSIVQLSKLKDDVDDLGFIRTVETTMLFAVKNTLAALEDEMWTNRVLFAVCWFLPRFLFREQYNCRVIFSSCLARVWLFDCVSDISPDIRSIVAIEVNQTFVYILLILLNSIPVSKLVRVCIFKVLRSLRLSVLINLILETMHCDLIKVVLVSLPSDDVDDFMEGSFGVLLLVFWEVIAENAVIWYFFESDLRQPDTLLRHLII